ncbi:hypothetical protein AB0G54_29435 [Streptomyces yokosukanensis]|uniref:hypothetical protein n=1 Tax=Streptomyces yokosukanensis TaxID=67386 RepID=UPI000ACA29BC|nr:hypothetical protein [Streptomyces yokosukanensis]
MRACSVHPNVVRGGVLSPIDRERAPGERRAATDMVIGSGLVASAIVGGGVFWLRRRR